MSDIPGRLRTLANYADLANEAPLLREAAAQIEALTKDAERYKFLRESIKAEPSRIAAQAMLWNHSSRSELDSAIDAAIKAKEAK